VRRVRSRRYAVTLLAMLRDAEADCRLVLEFCRTNRAGPLRPRPRRWRGGSGVGASTTCRATTRPKTAIWGLEQAAQKRTRNQLAAMKAAGCAALIS